MLIKRPPFKWGKPIFKKAFLCLVYKSVLGGTETKNETRTQSLRRNKGQPSIGFLPFIVSDFNPQPHPHTEGDYGRVT